MTLIDADLWLCLTLKKWHNIHQRLINSLKCIVVVERKNKLSERFRGFYPVVIDIETSGFNPTNNAILEVAAITLQMDNGGWLSIDKTLQFNINPFPDAVIEPAAIAFNGIDLTDLFRETVDEHVAIESIFKMVRKGMKQTGCSRAVMVAHNAQFDHDFLMVAAERCKIKRNPFHPFTTFDTAVLSGLVYGQTVLAKACETAGINFDHEEAHSALYDTQKTAHLFCDIVNRWKKFGGWPVPGKDKDSFSN